MTPLNAAVRNIPARATVAMFLVRRHHVFPPPTSRASPADLLGSDGVCACAAWPKLPALLVTENALPLSRTSVRWRWRISRAIFSREAAMSARTLRYCAWRSRLNDPGWRRGVTCSPSFLADFLFDFGAEVRSIAYSAGDFSQIPMVRASFVGSGAMFALIFGKPVWRYLRPKVDGLGVNAVGAADLGSVPELVGRAHRGLRRK